MSTLIFEIFDVVKFSRKRPTHRGEIEKPNTLALTKPAYVWYNFFMQSEETGKKRQKTRRKIKKWCEKQWEEVKFAVRGIVLATKFREFWLGFLATFVVFGTLLNLLSSGFAAFGLMGAMGFPTCLSVIWDAFLQLFGVNRAFIDWLGIFGITILQSLIIGLLVLVLKKQKGDNSAHVQNSGIIAGLAILGSGCPTCGTALLTPVLGAIFSTGGVAMAAKVSGVLTLLAVLLALWTLKKLGFDAYVIIMERRAKNGKRN